ncbi:hypothetical protein [Capnocytophaga sp.]|uniref:hypothetical protein n=1 Tax=Capnocytophaga sp. TaxID=44737 RepID=UPI0026DAC684|nr:hypothetical protein [Capnocytophaga sp.]MDO5106132.1 hypothetical protein [Capnocytophaga sp.]
MSSYQFFWIVLEPVSGKVTKRDVKAFNKADNLNRFTPMFNDRYIMAWVGSKSKALHLVSKLKGLAFKDYKATLLTDKQLGMIKQNHSDNSVYIPFTQKQLNESVNV